MKLLDYYYEYDYGHEWYLNVLTSRRLNLLQFSAGFQDYPGRAILLISFGGESLFGFSIHFWRFDFDFGFFVYRPRDLYEYQFGFYNSDR